MYLVQVVLGFCRWSGTHIPDKRSFDSLDVSHAPGELLFYLLTIWSAQLLTSNLVSCSRPNVYTYTPNFIWMCSLCRFPVAKNHNFWQILTFGGSSCTDPPPFSDEGQILCAIAEPQRTFTCQNSPESVYPNALCTVSSELFVFWFYFFLFFCFWAVC